MARTRLESAQIVLDQAAKLKRNWVSIQIDHEAPRIMVEKDEKLRLLNTFKEKVMLVVKGCYKKKENLSEEIKKTNNYDIEVQETLKILAVTIVELGDIINGVNMMIESIMGKRNG